ncbi:MAG TPA: hypothetical protein VEP49_20280 [Acidimicrobiia bacterium]|nr:hypothetical protein [Acidimicrobiia bacterium]
MVDERGGVRFFSVTDAEHYLGLVAMVRSLRLQGHRDALTVLDVGLTAEQRRALPAGVHAVHRTEADGRHPFLLSPFAALLDHRGTVVVIDSDVIVTASLAPVLADAQRGQVCAAPDRLPDRWFAEWESLFELGAPLRRQVYVNAGFVAFDTAHHPDLLARWWKCCDGLVGRAEVGMPRSDPRSLLDQDALNALLMSEVGAERLSFLAAETAIQGRTRLARTRVVDRRRLACRYEGHATVLLHAIGNPKPWQREAQPALRRTAYVLCLRELLARRPPATEYAPAWLRPGSAGRAALEVTVAAASARRWWSDARRAAGRLRRRLRAPS